MVRNKKRLQDLTIKDNFMFAAVMLEDENAKGLLELVLGIKIDHVDITQEKSLVYNPEYKGVRLDVYIKDDKGTHFNVEMQATSQPIEKRTRYYHCQIDSELLARGSDYDKLPDSYIIFICDFDPLGLKKYQYTVKQTLVEDEKFIYSDGNHTIFLSTVGTNENQVPEALVKFLKFVAADLKNSEIDYNDKFVSQLQNSVRKIKTSRDMEDRFMLFEEMMKNEYKAGHEDGKAEGLIEGETTGLIKGILQILNTKFTISDTLSERIKSVNDNNILTDLLIKASTSSSIKGFEDELENVLSDQVKSTTIQI